MRRTSHRCGAPTDTGPCLRPVRSPSHTCWQHPVGRKARRGKLAQATAASWNTENRSQAGAPTSKPARRLEQGFLRRILTGRLSFQHLAPKQRAKHGRWMAPATAAAVQVPRRRQNGQGAHRRVWLPSRVLQAVFRRDNDRTYS